jgi:hypothetical protein
MKRMSATQNGNARVDIILGIDDELHDPLGLAKMPGLAADVPTKNIDVAANTAKTATATTTLQPKAAPVKQDLNPVIDTIIGEALGEGPKGMEAVAAVIKNRAAAKGITLDDVVREPRQFPGFTNPGADAAKALHDPKVRQEAENALNGVLDGTVPDPTDGAKFYHRDDVYPSWAKSFTQTTQIGRHLFYRDGDKPADAGKNIVVDQDFKPEGNLWQPRDDSKVINAGKAAPSDDSADAARPSYKAFLETRTDKGKPAIEGMNDDFAGKVAQMFQSAPANIRDKLGVFSGYRSPEHQAELYQAALRKYGSPAIARKWVAPPGHSMHNSGLAADLSYDGRSLKDAPPEVVKWLHDNAGAYGLKFPLANENWHIEDSSTRAGEKLPLSALGFMTPDNADKASPFDAVLKGDNTRAFSPTDKVPGLIQPGNIDLSARPHVALDDGSTATVRSMSFEQDGKEILIPTVSDSGQLLDDQQAINLYKQTGKHLGIFDSVKSADAYADQLHKQQDEAYVKGNQTGTIVVDDTFKPQGTMFEPVQQQPIISPAQQSQMEANTLNMRRLDQTMSENASTDQLGANFEQRDPGRYKVMSEDEAAAFHDQWEKENRSSGVMGDAKRNMLAQNAQLGVVADELVRKIPGIGPGIADSMAAIDEWVTGKPMKQRLSEYSEKQMASTTPEDQAAQQKKAYDPSKPFYIGDALKDPHWYVAQVSGSLPSTAISMLPGGILARGAYLRGIAVGLTEKEAAASAAKSALIGGALTEGGITGAQSSLDVKQQIAAIPRETLLKSDAVKALVSQGLTEDEAIAAVTEDASTQAFIYGGVAAGMFGGLGDRMLAKILAEGVGGTVAKRILRGTLREGAAETLEETAQNAGQQLAENKAMQKVDPSRPLLKDVPEQAVTGAVVGGLTGGVLGGVTAGVSPEHTHEPADEAVPPIEQKPIVSEPVIDPAAAARRDADSAPDAAGAVQPPVKKGGIVDAIQRGVQAADASAKKVVRPRAVPDGMPPPGSTVHIQHDGVDMMGTIDSWENGEAVIMDSQTGEFLQVPPDAIKDVLHRPGEPIVQERKSVLPDQSEQKPAVDTIGGLPDPGKRVVVASEGEKPFAATVQDYDGSDTIVKTDDGRTLQVPAKDVTVSGLTTKQVDAQDEAINPPVEREQPEQTSTLRKVYNRNVDMPDERHAQLFDLGAERQVSKKLSGQGALAADRAMPAEQTRLAKEFGVTPEALGQMADDYRYRVERVAKQAKSDLPQKMYPVNGDLLKRFQTEAAKQQQKRIAAPKTEEAAALDLPAPAVAVNEQPAAIDVAAHEAATSPQNELSEPSQAQKEAGNYKLGHVRLGGLDISIENPQGSVRRGKSRSGKAWEVTMQSHYGYIKGTVGKDKDHIDVFVKPGTAELDDSAPVYVVDQRDPARGQFDEHKVMMGFATPKEARDAYLANYSKDWKGMSAVTPTTLGEFKTWLKEGDTKVPFAPKWFGSKEKAAEYISKEKLGHRYEVVPNGLKFEVRRKGESATPPVEPSKPVEEAPRRTVRDGSKQRPYEGHDLPTAGLAPANLHENGTVYVGRVGGSHFEIYDAHHDGLAGGWKSTGFVIPDGRYLDRKAALAWVKKHENANVKQSDNMPGELDALNYRESVSPKARQPKSVPVVSANTVFTDDAAAKARALLKSKLNQLNAGVDPEIMQAGIVLAGYHIEKGARTFAAYASAMLQDLGEVARPYLKSWYMGVKYDPRASDFDGMSSAAEVDGYDISANNIPETGENGREPENLGKSGEGALEAVPAPEVPAARKGRETGRSAEASSGPDLFGSEPVGSERLPTGRSVPDGARAVPVPAGERPAAAGSPAEPVAANGQSGNERPAVDEGRVEPSTADIHKDTDSAATPAQNLPVNYAISEDDQIGEGGAKTKYRANVAAIRILRDLAANNAIASRAEQSALAKWVGWGGLRNAFYREDGTVAKGWEKEAAELKELLTPEEYRAAESSTRNAHYTAPEVVSAMWDAVRRLGFTGGQVLEPSVGAGNFLGLLPAELWPGTKMTGVELDHITGSIAKNLYPAANIQAPVGFQDFAVPDDHFDLAIGNPPFGSEKLYDKNRRQISKFSIHNYFFAKSVDGLRPGGVLALVITNRFLDGNIDAARNYIAKKADLIGAIRLPNDAFLKNAGTEVTTDIVFLRKRIEGEKPGSMAWTEVGEFTDKEGRKVPLNRYFIENPRMMLGEFGAYGTMYGPEEPALISRDGANLGDEIKRAIDELPRNVMPEPGVAAKIVEPGAAREAKDVPVNSFFLTDKGEIHQRMPDALGEVQSQPVAIASETGRERVTGMIRMRDAFAALRKAQIDERAGDERIEKLRDALNKAYDPFVKKHGPINADANKRLFRDDPTWPQISALEEAFDKGVSAATAKSTGEQPRAPSARKAKIFSQRTQQPYKRPNRATSAKDALAQTLADLGRVDLDAMSRLYGKPVDDIVRELGGILYKTPAGAYETSDAYLSGNVRAKLAEAERALPHDPEMSRNVTALITISDRTSDGKSVVNQQETDAANEKVERVKAEWRRWLWEDDPPHRACTGSTTTPSTPTCSASSTVRT